MVRAKSTTLTIHIEPGLKEGLRPAADRAHRSIANMIEGLIRDYCGRKGIMTQAQVAPVPRRILGR